MPKIATRQLDNISEHDHHFKRSELDKNLEWSGVVHGTRRIGIAIVGVGRMGVIHLHNTIAEPRAKLMYVLDADMNRLNRLSELYYLPTRNTKILTMDQWGQVLANPAVELIIVATTTNSHDYIVRTALSAGKHILCEKPLSHSAEEVCALLSLAEAKSLHLVVALQRRYDPHFRRIKEQLQRGDIGPPRMIKSCSRDSPEPPFEYVKTSGGIFQDCAVHDVDCILWMAVELPYEVMAYGHSYAKNYQSVSDHDTVCFMMRFPSGLMSCTDLSRISMAGYEQRFEVFGHKGVLKLDEVNTTNWEKHTEIGIIKPGQCYSFSSRYREAYQKELRDIINKVDCQDHLDKYLPGYMGCLMNVIDALAESCELGRPVKVTYPYDCFAHMPCIRASDEKPLSY